jgi:hypothetical protein
MSGNLNSGIWMFFQISFHSVYNLIWESKICIIETSMHLSPCGTSLIGCEEIIKVQIPISCIIRASECHNDSNWDIIVRNESKCSLEKVFNYCYTTNSWSLLACSSTMPIL